jgi:acyl-CoA thioester hydrolase
MRTVALTEEFVFEFHVTWGDLDPIGHLRTAVYTDLAIDAQFKLLDRIGYSTAGLTELGYGPVVLRQESRYYSEVRFGEAIIDTLSLAGLSEDGSRWIVQHDFVRSDGQKAAMLKVEGTWIDLQTRDAIVPPKDLIATNDRLPRTKNFQDLRSLVPRK